MRVVRLRTVDALIAFDLDCPVSAGGTRLAIDATEEEARLLARAMTYKFALLGVPVGGAKAVIRARPEERAEAVERFCREILPMVEEQRFLTATDMGTFPEDFASLPGDRVDPAIQYMATGVGVAAAAGAALGDRGLAGATVALEGFGKIGTATARAVAARGGRLVALSTVHGCVRRPEGLDVDRLLALREEHGDGLVRHLGLEVIEPAALYETEADVLVPGARTGALDGDRAARVRARVVAPAANVPYTAAGLRALTDRGILALPDFACSVGTTLAIHAGPEATEAEVATGVERQVRDLVRSAMAHEEGPFAGACALADDYLETWVEEDQLPLEPPLA
jgi:glutamate dehydrogenase (NAD(P)+)